MLIKKIIIVLTINLFLLSGCTSIQKTPPLSSAIKIEKKNPIYKIFYGTNRKPINPNNIALGYSNKRANRLYTGFCEVLIPNSHKIGEIKGSLRDKILYFDLSYGDIKLKKISAFKNEDEFWRDLQNLFTQIDEKDVLIFIHGYNNSFEDAAIRAAQLGYDLGVKGVTAFYSWPSAANPIAYSSDEATIQASEKYIKQFIRGFVQKSGAKKVHIIAHSMGNRGLLRAINDIEKETPNIKFGQIILAAPDVDADLFKDISKAYTKLSNRTTLYVSPRDKAVWASKVKHLYPRVGIVTPVSVIDKIDTIQVNFNFDLLELGHTYFAQEKIILEDIKKLLEQNSNPINRNKLIPKLNNKHKRYWLLNLEDINR